MIILNQKIKLKTLILATVIMLFGGTFSASADIVPVQLLDFGIVAVVDNSVSSSLLIDEFDNIEVGRSFRLISRGQPAVYQITGLLPNVTYTVDVDVINISMNPGVPSLEYFDFSVVRVKNTILTDDSGQSILTFGGKITTSGSGRLDFAQATFTSNIRITINN